MTPGKTMGIVGLIPGVAGIIVSIIALIANIAITVALVGPFASIGSSAADLLEQCQNDPNGVVEFQGQEVPCSQLLEGTNP